MIQLIAFHIRKELLGREAAQAAFEYALVVGAIVVVFALGLIVAFPPVAEAVLGLACPSVDTADPAVSYGSCIGP